METSTSAATPPLEAIAPDASSTRRALSRRELSPAIQALTRVSNARFLADLAMNWGVIAAAASMALLTGHWLAYVAAIVVISTRQHALGVLMHDGTHYRCLTSRPLNDAASDIFCAMPVGMLTSRYRHEHLQHHRSLNTDDDPYWVDFQLDDTWHWPKPPAAAAWVFARDLLGLNSQRWGRVQWRWSPWVNHFQRSDPKGPPPTTPAERLRIYGFHTAVLGTLIATGAWVNFALLWLLPMMTLTPAMVRLRTVAEHLLIPNRSELDASRHTVGSVLERWSIAPHNINFHLGHHLYPAVPYYRLPQLHAGLMKDPSYAERIVTSPGYLGFDQGWMLGLMIKRAD